MLSPATESAATSWPDARGFLLTTGDFLGTLAAARDLGRHGIPVVLADSSEDTLSGHSRFVTRKLRCPPISEPEGDPDPARASRRETWLSLLRHPRSTLRLFFRP